MSNKPTQLYWQNKLVGLVAEIASTNPPWICGKLTVICMSSEMREALNDLHQKSLKAGGVTDWPFSDQYEIDWHVVYPNGVSCEICEPNVDFTTGVIMWA